VTVFLKRLGSVVLCEVDPDVPELMKNIGRG